MLKKFALAAIVLAVLLMAIAPYHPAQAAVRFRVSVGQPVYTYPYPYATPYPYPYAYPYYYSYPSPAYVYPNYPSYGFSFGVGHHREYRGREFRVEHRGHR